jgi:cation diffusion facilitator CzcD-associated flavoprotein CzcO
MVNRKSVCVIGAGVSGLAAARAFSAHGHTVTIIEKSAELGGVWDPARRYPGVQTQSPKELYRYTDKAMPDDYPEWPTGAQVHAYLADYARAHGLDRLVRFNTAVHAMDRRADGLPGWTLDLVARDGATSREDFDFVAVCTGQFNVPEILEVSGTDVFAAAGGTIMHSSTYQSAERVRGRSVVILGGSKSATDVAVNAVASGAGRVTLIYREPVWRIPYFIGGLINFKRILYIRAQEQMFAGWGIGPMARVAYMLARPLVWAHWRGLESLLKTQQKLARCGMVPTTRIEDDVNCALPIATPDFFEMVADGRIKAIRGSIDHYEPNAVVTSGGEHVPADIVVLAIGYRLGMPFLPDAYRARLVDADGQYRLYRQIVNPDLPDVGFVGFNSSFCSVLSSELAANWLVRYADGKLARQPTDRDMRSNIAMMARFKRIERPAAGVYGGQCVAPYHFRHFDELLSDLGAKTRRRHLLAEMFMPPDADAYGRFLASAPPYQVTG